MSNATAMSPAASGNGSVAAGAGRWIEGFGIAAPEGVATQDLEYQAVLGRGWLSPWILSGGFCGGRGMSLPILGLRGAAEGRCPS